MNALVAIAIAWLVGLMGASLTSPGLWQATASVCALLVGVLLTITRRGEQEQEQEPQSQAGWGRRRRFGVVPVPVRGGRRMAVALAAAMAAGLAVGPARGRELPTPPKGLCRVEAVVERVRYYADGRARSVIRVVKGERLEDSEPFAPGIRLKVGPVALPEGARVKLLVQVRPWMPFRNFTPHPRLPPSVVVQGGGWIPSPSAIEVVENGGLQGLVAAARSRVRRALWKTLPAREAGVAAALGLGDGSAVDPAQRDTVRAAGLAHLLAVSGLHVAIVAGLLVALMRVALLRVPVLARRFDSGRLACAAGAALVLLYAAFAGGAPSAWRAALTACIAWALVAIGRRPRADAVAAAAALVLGALRPHDAVHPGFMLSIAATVAVITAPEVRGDGTGVWLKRGFSVSWRTVLATAPIVLWCFGSVPLIGIAANVLLMPVGSLLLVPLANLHALVATVLPPLAPLTALPFSIACNAFLAACGLFAALPFSLPLPPPDLFQGAVIAVAAALLLARGSTRKRLVVVAVALALLAALEVRLRMVERPLGVVRVTYLDVGQGDAALVDLPDGRLMLIDAGGNPTGGPDPGEAVLLPLLRARRRERVDIAVLSHPHPDHYGGYRTLVEEVPIGELWDTGQAEAETMTDLGEPMTEAEALLARARAKGTRVLGPAELCGKPRRAGKARIEVVWPCPGYDPYSDQNDNSLVIRIEYVNQSFLFTGDLEAHAEEQLEGRGVALRAGVLKVPHHGSRTSSTEAFLRAVDPEVAVVSSGAFNDYGHPAAAVVERLRGAGARVMRVDRSGSVRITGDGRTLRVESWKR